MAELRFRRRNTDMNKPICMQNRWAVGPLVVSLFFVSGSTAKAQIIADGQWDVTYRWVSGSNSGTYGRRFSPNNGSNSSLVERSYSFNYLDQILYPLPSNGQNLDPQPLGGYELVSPQLGVAYDNRVEAYTAAHGYGTAAKAKAEGTVEVTYRWGSPLAGPGIETCRNRAMDR